jgi:hypothetical protein
MPEYYASQPNEAIRRETGHRFYDGLGYSQTGVRFAKILTLPASARGRYSESAFVVRWAV